MRVLDLDGDDYQRGYMQGKTLRVEYRKMLADFFGSELWHENKPPIIPNSVIKMIFGLWGVTRTRKVVRRYLPHQFHRIRGLGDGLGISRSLAWGLQYLEVMFCEAGKSIKAPASAGCTQIHALPKATADSKPWSGRNYDFPNILLEHQIVRRETPRHKDRLATITVGHVPLAAAHHGMNEAGLMAAANNARLWRGKDFNVMGVPGGLLLQEILETCRTSRQAADFMMNFPARANAGFFGFMDPEGDCIMVEYTASRAAIRRPDDAGVIAQANHFITMKDANLPDGAYWTVKGMEGLEYAFDTKARFGAADRLLHENAGHITLETMQSILRDHSFNNGEGSDCTVCCHGKSGSTLCSIICDVRDRTLWLADGNPCKSEYVKIPFRDRKQSSVPAKSESKT